MAHPQSTINVDRAVVLYRETAPLADLWAAVIADRADWQSVAAQDAFMDRVVHNAISAAYPPRAQYIRKWNGRGGGRIGRRIGGGGGRSRSRCGATDGADLSQAASSSTT